MMSPTRSTTRAPFTGPDALTLSRVPLALALVGVSLAAEPPARQLLVVLFVAAIITDVVDGWWARRLGTVSDRGAALDSFADATLAAGVAVAVVVTVEWTTGSWAWWAIVAVGVIRLAGLGVTLTRFRVVSIAHTWGNKATGLVVAAVALWALASGRLDDWLVAVACGVAAIAALEELAMAATARAYSRDRRGWWDRLRLPDS